MIVAIVALVAVQLSSPSIEQQEKVRLRAHFTAVVDELSARDVSGLSASAQQARAQHVAELVRYRDAGEFPHNEHAPVQTPVFIDNDGRACAVGHLLLQDGQLDLVEEIRATQNLGRVPELRAPALRAWAAENGFTIDELTRIQPAYPPYCEDTEGCVSECCIEPPAGESCGGFNQGMVCGDDGITYADQFVAENCGAKVVAAGECSGCASAGGSGLAALVVALFPWRRRRARQ